MCMFACAGQCLCVMRVLFHVCNACMYASVYACTFACIHACVQGMSVFIHLPRVSCMYACACMYSMHASMHARVSCGLPLCGVCNVCMSTYACLFACVMCMRDVPRCVDSLCGVVWFVHACVHACIYVICIYVCMCARM